MLRWEYRPGSALFLVWGQGRSDVASVGRYDLRRDARALFRSPGTNVVAARAPALGARLWALGYCTPPSAES